MRISKSFTIEPEVSEYVMKTKGEQSASERVNALLRRAMLQEQEEALEAEAAAFFGARQGRHPTLHRERGRPARFPERLEQGGPSI